MEEKDLIDLTDIFDRLFKATQRLWKICLVIIVLCLCFFEVKTFLTYHATYTSSMSIIVSSQQKDILVSSEATEDTNKAFQKAILSSSMQKIIAKDLGVSSLPASLNVNLISETNFLTISATSSNPKSAYDVIKSIEKNYGQVTKLMNDANIILIEEAKEAISPDTYPQYLKQAIYGIVVGILISFLIIIVNTLLRKTLSKESYIKEKLHLKRLGNIPEITNKKSSYQYCKQLLVTNKKIPSYFKESFRTLTLSILRKKDSQVFMITSTLPNEGKSTISSNAALMLALEGKKVVLLDFDLRNPSLYKIFKLDHPKEQIGDYLDGKCSLNDIITNSEVHPQLDLILGSKSYDHSIELLSRKKIESFLEELKRLYDYVIIDVPPVLLMQDALSVAKYSDSTILVIKQDYAKMYEIIDALDELYEINGNIMGCVLNSVKKSIFDEDTRGYGYGYGYGKTKEEIR